MKLKSLLILSHVAGLTSVADTMKLQLMILDGIS